MNFIRKTSLNLSKCQSSTKVFLNNLAILANQKCFISRNIPCMSLLSFNYPHQNQPPQHMNISKKYYVTIANDPKDKASTVTQKGTLKPNKSNYIEKNLFKVS